jgi:hypothetical protein
MATAFGAPALETALVVISDSTNFRGEGSEWDPSPVIAADPKLTTKAVPGNRAPKAPPIYVQALVNWHKIFEHIAQGAGLFFNKR